MFPFNEVVKDSTGSRHHLAIKIFLSCQYWLHVFDFKCLMFAGTFSLICLHSSILSLWLSGYIIVFPSLPKIVTQHSRTLEDWSDLYQDIWEPGDQTVSRCRRQEWGRGEWRSPPTCRPGPSLLSCQSPSGQCLAARYLTVRNVKL